MLDGIDTIDWASLRHAYGSAADVPDLLRALASREDGQRRQAIHELFGNIWHQGTVYPATAAAVPFLYELLGAPAVPGKSDIAMLLASIADGCGYLEVHAVDDFGETSWRKILASRGQSLEAAMEREAAETRAVRQAVSAGLPDLIPYLRDPDPEVRQSVAAVLRNFPEHSAATVGPLLAAADAETNKTVRKALLNSATLLQGRGG